MWKNISISNSWISAREAIFFQALSGNFIITICTLFYSPSWKKIIKGLILAIFGAVGPSYAWLIRQNMSDHMVKSCRLSHTIIICNMKSPPCTKLEILDFAQKLPGHAQIKEISISWDQIFFWTWNFQGWFLTLIAIISDIFGKI